LSKDGHARPAAVDLVAFVYAKCVWDRTGKVPYSKSGVLRRDGHCCAYCGKTATTMDQVVPRCQGGKTEWLNAVAACERCNNAKAGRTPEQAKMPLRFRPFIPTLANVYPRSR
jgi:5-methylcytosine-specific restriction endonuclease McrA